MRKIKVLLIALILVLGGTIFCEAYAAERSLGAELERPFNNLRYQYRVPGLTASGENTDILYTMVKIYDNADKDEADNLLYSKALYCLRGGVGFGSNEETDVSKNVTYNELGEMHKDAKTIIEKYKEYYKNSKGEPVNLDREETINDKQVNIYNAILWILDESYLRTSNEDLAKYNEAEYKAELLSKAGVRANEQAEITKDDIEVIQQLAVWYFTNYDEQIEGVKPTVSQSRMDVAAMLQINGDNDAFSGERLSNLNKLYKYFINGAINNSASYIVDVETGERTKNIEENKFDKNVETKIEEKRFENIKPTIPADEYYLVGPFKIDNGEKRVGETTVDVTNLVLYDANKTEVAHYYEFAAGDFVQVVEFINESDISKVDATSVTTLEKGLNYYIRINKFYVKDSGLDSIMPNEERYDLSNITLKITSSYTLSEATFLESGKDNQPVVEINKEKIYSGDEITTELPKEFDLSLRKFITRIKRGDNYQESETRAPKIDTTTLINGITNRDGSTEYTATYTHPKNPLSVEIGDKVIYTIRIYNEGEVDGTATSVTDYLPEGLKFIPASESEINTTYGWTNPSNDGKTIVTEYLKDKTIKAFDANKTEEEQGWQKATTGNGGLYYQDVQIECEVIAAATGEAQNLRNIAAITEDTGDDRDSVPGDPGRNDYNPPADNSTYKEDDDDYEDLVLPGKKFDLALRKYISSVKRDGENVEFDSREPQIDTTTLINGTYERNGQKEYTATYNHSKEPLVVKQGDVITYTLRIYNEGERDGYASQITDYIPEGLALIMGHNTNFNNGWKLSEDIDADEQIINLVGEKGFYKTEEEVKNLKLEDFEDITSLKEVQLATGRVTITSTMLEDELLKAFDKNKTQEEEGWQKATTGEGGLYYKDIEVTCLVVAENTRKDVLTNVAEISEDKDDKKQDVEDRDSTPNNVITKDEDDNDYEPVVLKCFDLALRKFITGVETEGKTNNITSRIPIPKIGEDGKIVYEHTKDPVEVAQNDTVIYTIRVYNEGTIAGYAEEITDDIPEGLEFIPEHNTNKEYQWVMIDKDGNITENVEEAVKITTDYLSKAKGEDKNLIDAFDISKGISKEEPLNPDYKDVKVAFKVEEPNTSDRIIINSAQISEDSGEDEDSIPDEWNEGEDDQDKEYIYVKYFDLSLLKWVTKTIVTVDGTTTTTQTNFKPNTGKTETTGIRDNNEAEPIAKVVIDKKKLKKTTVKFAYKIRVTNEGEIPGYAAEITDFIPEGLEFKAEDNKAFGWVEEGDNKVTTRALETKLLNPGESAELEIIFTWKNDAKNLGVKTNVAEITEDYNENNAEDIDSVPDNKKDPYEKEQEDDDDFALVILSIKTGKGTSYVLFITAMLTLLASGMYLIKKYVLTY